MTADASRGDEIRARLAAATPGPWYTESGGVFNETRTHLIVPTGDSDQDRADADLIAHAPDDIAWLLADNDRLRAENEMLGEELAVADKSAATYVAENGNLRAVAAQLAEALDHVIDLDGHCCAGDWDEDIPPCPVDPGLAAFRQLTSPQEPY